MSTILIPIVIVLILALVIEGTHASVYGWIIPEKDLDVYLNKYLPKATLNPFSGDCTLFSDMPKYVARSQTFLFKWSIRDFGVIPRWSKWSKILDEKRLELMATDSNYKKSLAEY